jgi:transposase
MPSARRTPKQLQIDGLPTIHPNAAGMDIGAEMIVVAVPPDRDPEPVRAFRTFTPDLRELAAWLIACGIDTVAMESTGVYWVALYELLEAQRIVPYLVNSRHVRMVPGRKTDWNDAQWLQKLHALGLLQASFRPDAEIVALRTLVRYRAEVVQHRSPHVNQMQQALKLMNVQLSEVLTDITGLTGMSIMRAIVAGERDPVTLAQFRAPSCKSSQEMIAKALTGTWKDEQIFVLEQALALYDAYTAQLEICDRRIEQYLQTMESRGTPNAPLPALPPSKHHKKAKNEASFNARAQYARIVGVDLVAGGGLSAGHVQTIITEVGTDRAVSRPASISVPGWGWRHAMRFPVARCCTRTRRKWRTERARRFGWLPMRSRGATRLWGRTIARCGPAKVHSRRLWPRPTRLPALSTTC